MKEGSSTTTSGFKVNKSSRRVGKQKLTLFHSIIMDETVYKEARDFLDPIYSDISLLNDRPFNTLTFAQSLDGKIAKQGQQVLISGKESMAMTHRLRTLHDGILVGIGTALVDDPQLNGRNYGYN
jgi:hypothetical protein